MNVYENIIILDPSLSDENIESSVKRITDLITGGGGEVLKVDRWGRKRLSYEIDKQAKGFYVLFLFRSAPDLIKGLEELYKVFDPVIKFMVVRLEKKQADAALESLKKEEPAPAGGAQG